MSYAARVLGRTLLAPALLATAAASLGCNALTGVSDLEPVACVDQACEIDETDAGDLDGALVDDARTDATTDATTDAATDSTTDTTIEAATDAAPADDADATPGDDADVGDATAFDAAGCTNGAKDGLETDVDCGGPCTKKCAESRACAIDADCTTGHCVGGKCAPCAAGMVVVSASKLARGCIDAREVTNAEYQAFLAKSPSTAGQPAVCSWNTSFVPSSAWPPLVKGSNLPVRYVDWCDAYAYCASVGKRLCGKVGTGGPVGYLQVTNVAEDEWMRACTALGTREYPYGTTYVAGRCNGALDGVGPVAVGTLSSCVTPQGAFDMAGNVAEWEDACLGTGGATDKCRARGGSFATSEPRCSVAEAFDRSARNDRVGFRCCDSAPDVGLILPE